MKNKINKYKGSMKKMKLAFVYPSNYGSLETIELLCDTFSGIINSFGDVCWDRFNWDILYVRISP